MMKASGAKPEPSFRRRPARSRDKAGSSGREAAAEGGLAIILVEPQLGENIGFAARAMANFGLNDLRLVAPRDGWPNQKARSASAGADAVIDKAELRATTELAVGGLNFVLATTARPRGLVKQVLTPESAARELRRRVAEGQHCGVLFGPEKSGLDNDTIVLADAIITAPIDPGFASLSLPQAVLLVCYEWLKAANAGTSLGRATQFDGPAAEGIPSADAVPAARAALFALFEHLERELDASGFLRPPEKRPAMLRNIRNMFHRMGLTDQDVRTWRGMIAALSGSRRRRTPGS